MRGNSSSGGGAESDPVSETYEPGTSGIRVYATQSGEYYHLSRECAGSEASYITLETALNYGKTACPICAKLHGGPHGLVARAAIRYFHIYREHAGEDATPGTLAVAHAMGKEYCPTCHGPLSRTAATDAAHVFRHLHHRARPASTSTRR